MKRDMDLCRRILLDVEANPEATGVKTIRLNIEDRDPAEVNYHVLLLRDAGFLETKDLSNLATGLHILPRRLTYAGHEFLEASRKESIWQRAKATVIEKTGGLSIEVLKAVLIKLATEAALG